MQPIQIISKRNELAIATHRFELNMKKGGWFIGSLGGNMHPIRETCQKFLV